MKKILARLGSLALVGALAAGGLVLAPVSAQAAPRDIDKLPFAKHASLEFLGSITLPASEGSLSDQEWLKGGSITTETALPPGTWSSRTKIVQADGKDTGAGAALMRDLEPDNAGFGYDGNPISLDLVRHGRYALSTGGIVDKSKIPAPDDIPAGDFWFVITAEIGKFPGGTDPIESPYFAIKLVSDGKNWKVAEDAPAQAKPTTTVFSHIASRTDGRVDFTATVTAEGGTVSGGTVDFVNAATDKVLATSAVVAGKAQATSAAPIDPVVPVSVKAVYRGAEGFAVSESAAQPVTGVRPPNPGSGEGEVVVEVPERDNAPAGAVKFTAAASANLGKAELTASGLSAAGSIDGATVTDTRRDKSAGWTVNGKASDFTIAGKAGTIPASALSWTPAVKAGTTLPAGATTGPANQKLDGERELVRWAAGGSSVGDAKSEVGASLKLEAQGNIAPGTYSAKLTLTLT